MVDVVRSKEYMEIGIVGFQRQLHQQKRQVNGDGRHEKQAHRDLP